MNCTFQRLPGHRSRHTGVLAVLALVLGAGMDSAAAQDIGNSITRSAKELGGLEDARRVRSSGPGPEMKVFGLQAPATEPQAEQAPPIRKLSLGVQSTESNTGDGLAVPFSYSHTTSSRLWSFRLESRYARSDAGNVRLEGIGGVTALASRVLMSRKPSQGVPGGSFQLLGTLGLGVPTGGDQGGDNYSQHARLIALYGRGKWTGVLAGVLLHVNGRDAGDLTRAIQGEAHYDVSDPGTMIVKINRTSVRNAGGSTTATLQYDHQFSKQWGIELIASRRFAGASATIGQVNAVYSF